MEYAAMAQAWGEEARKHIHGEGETIIGDIRQKEEGLRRAMQSMVEKSEVGTAMQSKWEEIMVGLRREMEKEIP
jgi:hypothetical protein